MPELPDVTVYVEVLRPRVVGRVLSRVRLRSPFVLRSVEPAVECAEGRRVIEVRRLGKRIVLGLEGEAFLVIHLMIAGRLRWREVGGPAKTEGRIELASFEFPTGTLVLTEAGTKKRASLHVVAGEAALRGHDPGGIDVLDADESAFAAALRRENHTLKRSLTEGRLFSGIGNAYSDEILHAARLSPLRLTGQMTGEEVSRLREAARETLLKWTDILREQFGLAAGGPGRFPGAGEVTAFRAGFAVHGRFGKPCPVCGHPVQRIVYAENETNYCAACQTGGRVLADRSMSRLLRDDWPRTIEELEGS